ncbi:hypothetical protein JRQ81_006943 [Phrynocephalus forsythii]|uniref:Uncharacterized protein n=1 Tax=Phrynocephalus forsythii TaxID=171643 RepID=A0A9Q1AUL6_9SAUR|nr:hypothetical protein JRQ81_006943 [Phrynocephalus forsythii]
MSAGPAYNEEKGGCSSLGEPEYGHDPASGGIFSSDYKRKHSHIEHLNGPAPKSVSSSLVPFDSQAARTD